jgi:hypothetical protein
MHPTTDPASRTAPHAHRTATRLAGAALAALALATACGSDGDSDAAAELSPAACDAYAAIGAAMFGDPSTIPDDLAAFTAAAPEELHHDVATYGDALLATFDGDEEAMTSAEFLAADRAIGESVFESCDVESKLDVTGIDFAFEGIPDSVDAGRAAIRFTNDTEHDEAHEMLVMKRAEGVDETVTELFELPEEELFSKVMPMAVAYADEAGGVNVALVDLEPGAYIAICMIPAESDGAPHAVHGMVDEFTVS